MISDLCGTWFRGPWISWAISSAHSYWSMPSEYPPPPLSTSIMATLFPFHVHHVNVFPFPIICDSTLARGGNTQPRYMHEPCSLVNLVHTYPTSLGDDNIMLRVCIRFVGPYLQNYWWNTMSYIHITFCRASSSNDVVPYMGSNQGWEITIG